MKKKIKRFLSQLMIGVMLLTSVNFPAFAEDPTPANHLIISQVYGAGGNSGAVYKRDFVELYNPTDSAIDLTGWSIQYKSATGTGSFAVASLSGSVIAKGYFLVALKAGTGGNGIDLPVTDLASDALDLSGSAGRVALVNSMTPVSGYPGTGIVDYVGFGSSPNDYEGSKAPAPSSTLAIVRITEGVDTDNNGTDFKTASPNPRSGIVAAPTKCANPVATIASGAVLEGVTVGFSTDTSGASIEYNTTSAAATEWTTGNSLKLNADTTVYVRATKSGLDNSDVSSFTYTVDKTSPLNISQAKALASGTANVKAQGVVTYVNGRNVYMQDDTGAICVYLNANATTLKKGDEIVVMGSRTDYSNLLEIANVNEAGVVVLASDKTAADRGTATIPQLLEKPEGKTAGYAHMCEVIKIAGASLVSTTQLSQEGQLLTIAPAINLASYSGVAVNDLVDVTVRFYDASGTLKAEVLALNKVGTDNKVRLTLSHPSADAVSGATLNITANDAGASIYYTLDGSEPSQSSTLYNGGVKLTGTIGQTITLKAIGYAAGKETSDVVTAQYKLITAPEPKSIKEVLALSSGTADVEVKGILSYFATSYGNPVIQSEIDGKVYSLYIFGAAPTGAKIGDEVKFKGTYTIYSGLPELTSVVSSGIISKKAPIPVQEITLADLKTNGLNMIGRVVKIKNATLGAYLASGNTPITDATGTMNLYKPTAYPSQVVAGDVVDVYAMVACYNTTVQLYTGTSEANGFNVYDVVNDTKAPLVTLKENYLPAKLGQDYILSATAEDNKGIQSVKVTYKIGSNTVSNQVMAYENANKEYQFVIPSAQITAAADEIEFTVTATDVTGLVTNSILKKVAIDSKAQVVSVLPARNSSSGDNKSPLVSVELQNAGESPVVKLTLKKGTTTILSEQAMTTVTLNTAYKYQTSNLSDGQYQAIVTVTRADNQVTTVSWNFVVGTPSFRAYFGQLHGHTAQYSDGSGTLADGLNYLKNIPAADNVDFVSFTDHSNYFDTTAAFNPADALNDPALMTAASLDKWKTYVSDMQAFNESNTASKLAFPGFEMTWSGGPGHINTFNSKGLVSRNNTTLNSKAGDAGLKAYYETLIKNTDPLANLSQFNHPGSTFGTFADFAYWSPAYDNKMVSVEVGNGEGAIGSGGYFPSYTEYTKALDKGWHVAPTNNQDNHKGMWGNANNARTVIITDDFSQTGLLNGLKNMSVYATEDKNLSINYTVNDQMMGSIIATVPTEPLRFAINLDDPDANDVISKVEIVTNGGKVATKKTFEGNSVSWSFELPAIQGYYYVRVTQADKNIAVTAPVWIGQAPLVGISSFECGTKMPVTGEALNLTATLFNNEASAVTLKNISYAINGETVKTETLDQSIATTATFKHNFAYTPQLPGEATASVTVEFLVGSDVKTFTQDIKLNVRDSAKLVYVGIDASHNNEYVSGNYKDSMGNFADVAVTSDVRVVILNTSEDLIAATKNPKFKMIVLTPPTRRNGNDFLVGYKNYTDAEVAAIKAYAELGNTLLIANWGDFYESYTKFTDGKPHTLPAVDHMAAQQNRLLEAIGSMLRVSDDEIKDDKTNGGQPQRLYLKDYNLNNPFLARVKPLEQVYSSYGGSTIYAVGADKAPSATLPASVSPMVYSFNTSYSSDDDKTGTTHVNGVLVPKYQDKYMLAASETLSHSNGKTSMVIVAGSAMMSNFEIKTTMDSYATPEYSNYTILENVVRYINPVNLTSIAAVHAANPGETFTIRGIVTSNASGYDKDTAFFDCIYVQDATGGINAFPVAGNVKKGQTVEITGKTSAYNGERQIAVEKILILDENVKPLPNAKMITTKQASESAYLGSLVTVTGTIIKLNYANNLIESIIVRDGTGVACRVFIDGYITQTKAISYLALGNTLTATGLASIDPDGARIRIRDRADIACSVPQTDSGSTTPGGNTSGTAGGQQPTPTTPTTPPVTPATPPVTPPVVPPASNPETKAVTASVTISETVSKDGKTTAAVSNDNLSKILEQLQQTVVELGQKKIVELKVETKPEDKDIKVVIDKEAFNQLAGKSEANVKVTTALASIEMNKETLSTIQKSAQNADVSIDVVKVDSQTLPEAAKALVGNRPVYDFTVTAGSTKVSDFGGGEVQISLPYTLQAGESESAIVVYFIDDAGKMNTVRGNYNPETKAVVFKTGHFSTYALGYNKVDFKDVSSKAWYSEAVNFVTSRQIASGTTQDTFGPNEAVTRAQFVVMLMNAYGIKADATLKDNFADAGNTYYTAYLATAKKMGIISGTGNNSFSPMAKLSRQDMCTMLYKALAVLNDLPSGNKVVNANDYQDLGSVSSYAKDSVKAFVELGYLSGSGKNIHPKETATRAELAQILFKLLKM